MNVFVSFVPSERFVWCDNLECTQFKDAYSDMNKRENIIVMVDEAHRTQEGDLGRKMRNALPNAFLFGLTGTPINKADKNTFWAFGAEQDNGGYMSRYTFQESIRLMI